METLIGMSCSICIPFEVKNANPIASLQSSLLFCLEDAPSLHFDEWDTGSIFQSRNQALSNESKK